MDFFNHPHYRAGKNVSCLIGQWPYQGRVIRRICSSSTIILFITQFLAQVFGLIVHSDDNEVILELVTPFIVDAGMMVKYVNTAINTKTMMKLLDRLKEDCTIYTRKEEKSILDEYAYIGQLIVYGYIIAIYITVFVFISEPLMPKWINFILGSNETVPNKYPVVIYYYLIDMEENYYPILCYELLCIVAILTITVANDSMFIIFLQHSCALFAVVGYQLKNLPNADDWQKNWNYNGKSSKVNDIQYDYYVMCIKNHKRAIDFAKDLEDMYVWSFGMVVALNMPIMSVTAVQLVTQADTINKIIKYSMFACSQLMHLFFDCYLSQRLTDCSTAVQENITYSNWYRMPLESRKLVTMVILRSQTPCRLTAGKIVLLSMETFGVIVKTSISYFTVMVSMR